MKTLNIFLFSILVLIFSCQEKPDNKDEKKKDDKPVEKQDTIKRFCVFVDTSLKQECGASVNVITINADKRFNPVTVSVQNTGGCSVKMVSQQNGGTKYWEMMTLKSKTSGSVSFDFKDDDNQTTFVIQCIKSETSKICDAKVIITGNGADMPQGSNYKIVKAPVGICGYNDSGECTGKMAITYTFWNYAKSKVNITIDVPKTSGVFSCPYKVYCYPEGDTLKPPFGHTSSTTNLVGYGGEMRIYSGCDKGSPDTVSYCNGRYTVTMNK